MQNQIGKVVFKQGIRQQNRYASSLLASQIRLQNFSSQHKTQKKAVLGNNMANILVASAGIFGLGYFSYKKFSSTNTVAYAEEEMNEFEIDFASSLQEGQMQELKVGPKDDDKVLVARYQGNLHCIGNSCTHFGAPLGTGLLFDDKVVCPWHGASFSVVTGALNGGPGLDGVASYKVYQKDGKYFVKVPTKLPGGQPQNMAKRDPNNKKKFVIIGGGASGLTCAEALRQSDFTGEITVISNEDILPYDRTLLTKVLPTGDANKWLMRPKNFLEGADINYKLGSKVERVDTVGKKVVLSNGEQYEYDKLCLATGGTPRHLNIPGHDLKNVYTLRNHADQQTLKEKIANAKSIAIIGASFIGSESAASIKGQYKDQKEVHIIDFAQVPMQNVMGKEIGQMIADEHTKNGVKLHLGASLKEFKGSDNGVQSVVLNDGAEIVKADLVLVGIGVTPATGFVKDTKIELDQMGGVVCNPFLQSSEPDIYAAGDIASFPYWPQGNRIRVEHWNHAQDTGAYAAFNMLGKMTPYGRVPFFWTRHYNKSMAYVGYAFKPDEIYIQGDVKEQKFLAYFIKGNVVHAAAGMANSHGILTIQEAISQGVMPSASDIKSGKETIQTIQSKLKTTKAGKCTREHCCQKKPVQSQ